MTKSELHRQRIELYIAEGFTVSGGKGDNTAQSAEQSQAAFTQTLQQAFNSQFATQQATLGFLNNTLQNEVTNPTGYGATDLAAQRTSATDTIAAQAQNAQRATQGRAAMTGGANLPSGVNQQIAAEEQTAAGQAEAGAQNQITQNNANLKMQQQQAGLSGLSGVAQINNPNQYASSANQGSGEVAGLSQAVTQANGPGIGQTLAGVTTGIGGAVIGGAGKAGGFSSLFS